MQLKITLKKSLIGSTKRQRQTAYMLGLRRIGASVVQADNPCLRGMLNKIRHLVQIEEIDDATA